MSFGVKQIILLVSIGLCAVAFIAMNIKILPESKNVFRDPASISTSCQSELEENKFKITSYNVFLRPTLIFDDGQVKRSKLLPRYLLGNDVLLFIEAFDDEAREILLNGLNSKYPYQTKILGSDGVVGQDGGILIASCWPIIEEDEIFYGDVCKNQFSDCMSEKGVKYAKIDKMGLIFHIFATHLEAGFEIGHHATRKAELKLLAQFVQSKNIPKTDIVLIGGDFNINYIDNPVSSFRENTDEYLTLLNILQVNLPTIEGYRYTCDPRINDLADKAIQPEFIDYIFVARGYRVPRSSNLEVVKIKEANAWTSEYLSNEYHDLSDHFPVRGTFEF